MPVSRCRLGHLRYLYRMAGARCRLGNSRVIFLRFLHVFPTACIQPEPVRAEETHSESTSVFGVSITSKRMILSQILL